jgi:hypothetical protein
VVLIIGNFVKNGDPCLTKFSVDNRISFELVGELKCSGRLESAGEFVWIIEETLYHLLAIHF